MKFGLFDPAIRSRDYSVGLDTFYAVLRESAWTVKKAEESKSQLYQMH